MGNKCPQETHHMLEQEQTSMMRSGRGNSMLRYQHTHPGAPSWCKQMLPQEAGHAGLYNDNIAQHNIEVGTEYFLIK